MNVILKLLIMSKEVFRPVKGYEGLYEVSNTGKVASLNYNSTKQRKLLVPQKCTNGYFFVMLSRNHKQKMKYIHRLVAEAFVPNPNGLPQVNHLNENKRDNRTENLQWVSARENLNYGTRNQRIGLALKGRRRWAVMKAVVAIDDEGNEYHFSSYTDAAIEMGTSIGGISHAIKSGYRCAGCIWRLEDAA
jgi:hypothetical protein